MFWIESAVQFFQVFATQVRDFEEDSLHPAKAIACALFGWHLTEWVFSEYSEQLGVRELKEFQKELRNQCPELGCLQDLINGTKHVQITRYDPKVESADLYEGAFSDGFSNGFDVSRLQIRRFDGSVVWMEDLLKSVLDFWQGFFSAELGIHLEASE